VVEGSVRRLDNGVRVIAQLIDTRDGTQRWSQTYDRDFSDLPGIQRQIATAVARALQLEVAFVSAEASVVNTEAYEEYLRALHASDRNDQPGFEEAIAHYRRALQLDPTLVDAAVALAEDLSNMASWGYVAPDPGWEQVRLAAQSALKLDPKSARAHAVLGDRYLQYEWNWSAAHRELQFALKLAPQDSTVLGQAAFERLVMDRPDEALRYLRAALAIDPLHANRHFACMWSYLRLGRLTEAEASARRALEISPTFTYGHYFLSLVLLKQGKGAEALSEAQKESEEGGRTMGLALAHHALGQRAQADAALARLERDYGDSLATYVAEVYAFRGQNDRAFEWLDRAFAQHDSALYYVKQDVLLASLQADPRFAAFLRRMKLPV
jgi:tetratricopeptide (TPR) repeat protein